MKYLNVGTSYLSKDLFLKIKNTENLKPTGGIWASLYNEEYIDYNQWIDYICYNPYIIYYHNYENPYKLPAVTFSLKDESNLFIVDNYDKINYLKNKYPFNKTIDYEALSKEYDGILVLLKNFSKFKFEEKQIAESFSVDTLILFNIDCIKYYQKANINLDESCLNIKRGFPEYTIKVDKNINKIDNEDINIQKLINYIKNYIIENNIKLTYENIQIIKDIFSKRINEVLINQDIPKKEALLVRKVFNQF